MSFGLLTITIGIRLLKLSLTFSPIRLRLVQGYRLPVGISIPSLPQEVSYPLQKNTKTKEIKIINWQAGALRESTGLSPVAL